MNTEKRIAIYSTLREQMPQPTTELNYKNPFELMVAVILSAQATDISVNKATDKLYPVACTPESILALGADGLKENYLPKMKAIMGATPLVQQGKSYTLKFTAPKKAISGSPSTNKSLLAS